MRRAAIRLAAPLLKEAPSKQTCPTQTGRISRDIYTCFPLVLFWVLFEMITVSRYMTFFWFLHAHLGANHIFS